MQTAAVVAGAAGIVAAIIAYLTHGQGLVEAEMRFTTPLEADEVRARGAGVLLPLMAHHQFALRELDGGDLAIFQRMYRPRWTYYVAVLLWPIGLLALYRRIWIQAAVRIESGPEGSVVVVEGELTNALHDALRDSFEA